MNYIWVALYYDFEAWFKINFQDCSGIPNVIFTSTCVLLPNPNVLFATAICSHTLFQTEGILTEPLSNGKELGIWISLFLQKVHENLHSVGRNYTKIYNYRTNIEWLVICLHVPEMSAIIVILHTCSWKM